MFFLQRKVIEKNATKKVLTVFVLCLLLILTGCGRKSQEEEQQAELPVLNIYLPEDSGNLTDVSMVNDALNEYIAPILQAKVKLNFLSNYNNNIPEILASENQADIVYCQDTDTMERWVENEWLCELTDLLERYGSDIAEEVSVIYFPWYGSDKLLYALPTNRDRARSFGIEYNAELAAKYGLDMSSVKELSDLTSIFEKLREQAPQIAPIAVENERFIYWDMVDGGYGALKNPSKETRLVNEFATEEFKEFVLLIREWNRKGYLLDRAQEPGNIMYYLRSGEVFCAAAGGKPGIETQETRYSGYQIGFQELAPPLTTNEELAVALYAVPKNTVDSGLAMQLLNLMYTDPVVANLFVNGIEGVHYEFQDEEQKVIGYPEVSDVNTVGYTGFMGWRYCNQYLTYVWEGDEPDIWEQMEEYNKNAAVSMAFGFSFNSKNVAGEIEACDEVLEQYLDGFFAGIYEDTGQTLENFLRKLSEAGIDKIIEEKQKQFYFWLEYNLRGSDP